MKERRLPRVTVDAIIVDQGSVLLIKRRREPFEGKWALPGGFVEYGETTEEAVKRETAEETGLRVQVERLVGVYSDPDRDPRGHSITVAYLCNVVGGEEKAGDDAREVRWYQVEKLPDLAFDHRRIIEDALDMRLGGKDKTGSLRA